MSALGPGCMGYGDYDEAESVATIRLALDRGVTLFDTAGIDGQGQNEARLHKALGPPQRGDMGHRVRQRPRLEPVARRQ